MPWLPVDKSLGEERGEDRRKAAQNAIWNGSQKVERGAKRRKELREEKKGNVSKRCTKGGGGGKKY